MAYKNNKTVNRRRYKSRYHSPHNYKTKKTEHQYRIPVIVALATFVVIASLVVVFTFGDKIFAYLDQNVNVKSPLEITPATLAVETISPDEISTEAAPADTPATEAPAPEPPKQSEEFETLLKKAGIVATGISGTQEIIVESSGTSAKIYTYEKGDDGVWVKKFEPISGFVGEGGVGNSAPLDAVTPKGSFRIEYAFGHQPNPGTALTYYPIDNSMFWVTDPNSINYNLLCDSSAATHDWTDAQWLYEYTVSYPYAVVFNYNRDPVSSSLGAAKFLHVSSGPTSGGGIGMDENSLRSILEWLKPEAAAIDIF
ncbi:MAG: hypothetical protein IJH32_07985 [Ruminococcus sp.]|nr:hypothetical protein [Ruminococcus sp.]